MQLTLHTGGENLVRAYSDQSVTIREQVFEESVLVLPDALVSSWQVSQLTELSQEHAQSVLAHEPEMVIVGSEVGVALIPQQFSAPLAAQHIGCDAMDVGAAARTYNVLASEGRRPLAMFLF